MDALGLKTEANFSEARAGLPPLSGRWRWIVTSEETHAFFAEQAVVPYPEPVTLSVSPVRVGSCNWDARFKTLSYLPHAQAWKTASTTESVLLNERGHVASAARGNIFWKRGVRLFTPAHEAGCRCGVVRSLVLKRQKVEEGNFPLSDLLAADEIFVTNSMKGIVSIKVVEGRPIASTTSADIVRGAYEEAVAEQTKA